MRCTRKGCGQEYTENSTEKCLHHPGAPVFHEGLKSWSCCATVNKPVLDFDEFMSIPGCVEADAHSNDSPKVEAPKPTPTTNLSQHTDAEGKEVYTTAPKVKTVVDAQMAAPAPEILEEEDDLSVVVKPGTPCRRKGCRTFFVSDEINRSENGEGSVCIYHPAPPIFHEGSKGYFCCKRRVLEFDEFLKIEGCKTGRHVFAPRVSDPKAEENVNCRIDHYQTLEQVHVSIFGKQVDKTHSTVEFREDQVTLDLRLPGSKRFRHTLNLFGPINPERSTFQVMGTKVDLHLQKMDTRSWVVLEKTDKNIGNVSLTFGVKGRTGTVGAKEVILDESNTAKIAQG